MEAETHKVLMDAFHNCMVNMLANDDLSVEQHARQIGSFMGLAAREGMIQPIQSLLDAGAHPDYSDPEDIWYRSSLHFAAAGGHLELVKFLLERGADINIKDLEQRTAAHHAAGEGQLDVLQYLLEQGASTSVVDRDGYTVLLYATSLGHVETCLFLLRYVDINIQDNQGWTPLHSAVTFGYNTLIHHFLKAGANTNLRTDFGENALSLAASKSNTDILRQMLDCGADIHNVDHSGFTPLGRAVLSDSIHVCKFLLNMGAFPIITNDPDVLEHAAVIQESPALTHLLLEGGYDIHRDPWLESPPIDSDSELHHQLYELSRNPYSLRTLSLLEVRATLGRDKHAKSQSLPLPPELKEMVGGIYI